MAGLNVLVVNAGSTSLKLALVDERGGVTPVDDFVEADAVGHRIVHLGDLVLEAAVVEDWLLPSIEEGAQIAPLHNRAALDALERARAALPDVPHVAVSDSHFHGTMAEEARRYALRRDWSSIVRLGFHGLAVQSVVEQVDAERVVVCHLGGGCSVTAVRNGRSIDTTMGYTPLEGPPMGTRSGSIDPGAILHLLRRGHTIDELDHVLNEESGLKALGGLDEPFAFSHFTYHLAKEVAGMMAVLGGIDVLAFSGGIGENRADVREAVARRLGHLGEFRVTAVPAREELVIARTVRRALSAAPSR